MQTFAKRMPSCPFPHEEPVHDDGSVLESSCSLTEACFSHPPADRSSHLLDIIIPLLEFFLKDFPNASLECKFSKMHSSNENGSCGGDLGAPDPPSGAGSPRLSESFPRSRKKPQANQRVVHINNPEWTNERYEFSGNTVRTSKYTLLSFLPRNLFEQFHRIAYIYFLIIVILNQIPQLAVFGRTASLFPLLFVLIVTAIKDGYEDWGRHRSDKDENNRTVSVLQDGHFKPKKRKRLKVGEVVKIYANETIPGDIVLLKTSDKTGAAYVQTINLDGESTLKTRYARQEAACKNPELGPISGTIVCENPNRNIYEFVAYIEIDGVQTPLGPNNIVLRGCELKNTCWVVGVVVYAGRETKAMLNSSGAQSKRSRLEQEMNRETLWLSVFLLVICTIGGVGLGIWVALRQAQLDVLPFFRENDMEGMPYMYYGPMGEAFFGFLSYIIMFQIMIPISLYISLEFVRLGQSYFMVRDPEMFHSGSNTRFQCRALNINEDLGQITYVFSDKTGTLTKNKMEFHTASINGVDYSNGKLMNFSAEVKDSCRLEGEQIIQEPWLNHAWSPKAGAKVDPKLVRLLQSSANNMDRKIVHEYFLALAACNTIVPTRVHLSPSGQLEMRLASAGDEGVGIIEFQGESPDEQALVAAAASYGYTLIERTSSYIIIDVLGDLQRFEVLGIHEFDSVRKCMSVILKCPDSRIKLLVKGADSAVINYIGKSNASTLGPSNEQHILSEEKHQAELMAATLSHLDRYAREGLRTLVIAGKDLSFSEFEAWYKQYLKASTSLVNRVKMLRVTASMVEDNLLLLGATGIEDKLQEGVTETITLLREAGIKVWVLTGDKQETAISIGFSCMLLTHDMQQIIINESSKDRCREALRAAIMEYGLLGDTKRSRPQNHTCPKSCINVSSSVSVYSELGCEHTASSKAASKQPLALIIDGNTLVHALSQELEDELLVLATSCKVVLCCRVAPLQKAGIVSLIKRKTREMTLAIGDGANDVSMIQTADVGIGLSGQEGRQAVMASDFAMGQFRFLRQLLLIHGHWNYQRLAYMVLYNFYRNVVFVMMLFWYILHTAFSPSTAIFDWNLVFYTLLYTSLPTVVVGILDKDISHTTLLNYPPLYGFGQRGEGYNPILFWGTMLDTLWQSLVLFYVPYFTFEATTIDIWSIGSVWIALVVILVNLHLALDIYRWTWITHVAIWGSILVTYTCFFFLDSFPEGSFISHYWVIYHIIGTPVYWLDIMLVIILALLPRFCVKVLRRQFWPSDVQLAREAELKRKLGRNAHSPVELSIVPDPVSFEASLLSAC